MIIQKVISGGQTGVDQAGWRAAKRCGIPTGGWMPKGWATEDGPRPEFAEIYGAQETKSRGYSVRTSQNVWDSDATILFGSDLSPGFRLTLRIANDLCKPVSIVTERVMKTWGFGYVADWIIGNEFKIVNIAGNRESANLGIGERVESFLVQVFEELKKENPNA